MISITAVAGNPQSTPKANLLNAAACSPCIYNHMILNKLTNGRAAMIPPYTGYLLAISVTIEITIAEAIIFAITYISSHARLRFLSLAQQQSVLHHLTAVSLVLILSHPSLYFDARLVYRHL